MSIEIVQGTTRKPVATEQLKVLLSQQIAGRQMIDALLVSADKGIVLFDLIEGNELSQSGSTAMGHKAGSENEQRSRARCATELGKQLFMWPKSCPDDEPHRRSVGLTVYSAGAVAPSYRNDSRAANDRRLAGVC